MKQDRGALNGCHPSNRRFWVYSRTNGNTKEVSMDEFNISEKLRRARMKKGMNLKTLAR